MMDWILAHEETLAWLGLAGIVMVVGSLLALPLVIASMPGDYLLREKRERFLHLSPWRRLLHVLKNVLGTVLTFAGLAMLLLPGQGILTILVGLSLIDFPGKQRLQVRLARIPKVRTSIDWIRLKAHKEPLTLP